MTFTLFLHTFVCCKPVNYQSSTKADSESRKNLKALDFPVTKVAEGIVDLWEQSTIHRTEDFGAAFELLDLSLEKESKLPRFMTWYQEHEFADLLKSELSKKDTDIKNIFSRGSDKIIDGFNEDFITKIMNNESVSISRIPSVPNFVSEIFDLKRKLVGFPFRENFSHETEMTALVTYSPAFVRHFFKFFNVFNSNQGSTCSENFLNIILSDKRKNFSRCMIEFPHDAAVAKAVFLPEKKDGKSKFLDIYDLSARSFFEIAKQKEAKWIKKSQEKISDLIDKGEIYYFTDKNNVRHAMPAFHIISKTIPKWMWVSIMFRSINAAKKNELFPYKDKKPWSNYSVCVTSTFEERDPDLDIFMNSSIDGDFLPDGISSIQELDTRIKKLVDQPIEDLVKTTSTLRKNHKALFAANFMMRKFHGSRQYRKRLGDNHLYGSSWCSNPYIEGEAPATNCIGCHAKLDEVHKVDNQQSFDSDFSTQHNRITELILETLKKYGIEP